MCTLGVTYALAAIFSTGQRKQLLPFASQMWTDAAQLLSSRTAASSVVARKFATKLVQRIGLTFLPATVAAWRYQQTNVSINDSLSNINSNKPATEATPSEWTLPSSIQPTGAGNQLSITRGAAQLHQSSACAPGVTNDESARPALQPSPLVNASPTTSPTTKAHTLGSDRQHSSAASTLHLCQGSQSADEAIHQPHSSLQPAVHDTASIRQTLGAEEAAASAQASHEPSPEDDSTFADGDCEEDIPEEIEEVHIEPIQDIYMLYTGEVKCNICIMAQSNQVPCTIKVTLCPHDAAVLQCVRWHICTVLQMSAW